MEKEGDPPDCDLREKLRTFYYQEINEAPPHSGFDRGFQEFMILFEQKAYGVFAVEGSWQGLENCEEFRSYLQRETHYALEKTFNFNEMKGKFEGVDGKIHSEMRDRVIRAVVRNALEGNDLNDTLEGRVKPIPMRCGFDKNDPFVNYNESQGTEDSFSFSCFSRNMPA